MSSIYIYQVGGIYEVRKRAQHTHCDVVSGQRNGPGATEPKNQSHSDSRFFKSIPPLGPSHTSTCNNSLWHVEIIGRIKFEFSNEVF